MWCTIHSQTKVICEPNDDGSIWFFFQYFDGVDYEISEENDCSVIIDKEGVQDLMDHLESYKTFVYQDSKGIEVVISPMNHRFLIQSGNTEVLVCRNHLMKILDDTLSS